MNIENMGAVIGASLKAYGEDTPRSRQSQEGILGPSDLGFCRMKAVLMTRGVEQSDSVSISAAQIGTAIHEYVGTALKEKFPHWLIEDRRVTAEFPSGAEISGTPDIIAPDYNAVIDVKTVDGFGWVKRDGTSQNHKYQRTAYALGAMQAGLLDGEKTMYVGNLYIDRSGKEPEPYFLFEEFDWTLVSEIDAWIGDVKYAVINNEDAARDIPAPVCQKICSHYTTCRGGMLPVEEGQDVIDSGEIVDAVTMLVEAREQIKAAESNKRAATAILTDVNAIVQTSNGMYQARTTYVNPTSVPAQERDGYTRVDVRKVKTK